MAFRTVVISNPTELHIRSGQLVAIQDQTFWIPTEDIAVLVLENPRVTLSSAALSHLADRGVAVAVCNGKHMPTGLLVPHCAHSRHVAVLRSQLSATQPLKKRLWQALVRAKIENQARCLDFLGIRGGDTLRSYAARVLSGDSGAQEATAARFYFPRIMPGVPRHSGRFPDPSLDYGYAIVRAAVARALVGHGMLPALGIHHDAQLNAFNLADDLLEPFRPFVDLLASLTSADVKEKAGRELMIGVLHQPCMVGNQEFSVLTAIDVAAASLAASLRSRDFRQIRVPVLKEPSRLDGALRE